MNDSNIANPAPAPGLAHSVSPTVRSIFKDDSVSSQSTGCEVKVKRSAGGHARGCFRRDSNNLLAYMSTEMRYQSLEFS